MKNSFELIYSPEFYKDLNVIINYIKYELKNIIAANNLIDKVEKEINNRMKNPLNFEKYKTKSGNTYYRLYVNNYIIFYTVFEDKITIRRIIYKKRDMTKNI